MVRRVSNDASFGQPIIVSALYALARLWISWGVEPHGMLGHSLGEYVAACLAGVFELSDMLRLVACRARLMSAAPPGKMMSVALNEGALAPILDPRIDIAAINGKALTVIAGPSDVIDRFGDLLRHRGHDARLLETSGAFHSRLMDGVVGPFTSAVAATPRGALRRPYITSRTGRWATEAEAQNPESWGQQSDSPSVLLIRLTSC